MPSSDVGARAHTVLILCLLDYSDLIWFRDFEGMLSGGYGIVPRLPGDDVIRPWQRAMIISLHDPCVLLRTGIIRLITSHIILPRDSLFSNIFAKPGRKA